jgi:DGQHR domain-containing protein
MGNPDETLKLDFIKADKKYVVGNNGSKADIYLVKFKIDQLLELAKVSRYEGLPFVLESSDSQVNYQRLLEDEKLESIANGFINNNKRKTFPNTITLALSSECEEVESGRKLSIPKRYSSIDIIDGQHRLFGYTRQAVNQEVREEAEILATALKFDTLDPEVINKNAARVFCEINSTQAKVKKDLLYLIKYDVLGEKDYLAAAGKILLQCDRRDGVLGGMFKISSLRRKNRLNFPCIGVVDVIEKEITALLAGLDLNDDKAQESHIQTVFNVQDSFQDNPEGYINGAVPLLESYFSRVKTVFPRDWTKDAEAFLLTEAYILAFIRFLRHRLYGLSETIEGIQGVLYNLKSEVDELTQPDNSPSFPNNSDQLPHPEKGYEVVCAFLIDRINQAR